MAIFSIIDKSQLEGKIRFDAEYYQLEYLEANNLIKRKKYKTLGEIITTITDYHANGSYQSLKQNVELLDNPNFALMIRTVDLENENYVTDVKYISKDAYNFLKKTKIFGGEIIINKIGNAGKVYLMPKLRRYVSLGMNQFLLRVSNKINSNYLYIYLISKYGERIISQKITGAVPLSIDKDSVRSILVPILPQNIQDEINSLVNKIYSIKEQSRSFYAQAEELLLTELGLKDFQVEADLSYMVNLSEVKTAHRIDSEYFQPKYDRLIKYIQKNFNPKPLEYFVGKYGTGYPFESSNYQKEGIPLIRINNIKKLFLDLSDTVFLSREDYELAPKEIAKPGDIVLGMSGTIGTTAIIPEDITQCSINQRILHFTPANAKPLYLVTLLNSLVVSLQLQRVGTGGVQTNISYKDIKKIFIPILSDSTQAKIASLVQQSYELRKKAKSFLEEAKRKVEQEIEKG